MAQRRVLVFGYGNPGRLDDGLGPALAERIDELDLPGVTVDSDYQLMIEDAADVATYDTVLFADAAVTGNGPFWVKRLEPGDGRVGFSTHSVDPVALLALARDLFGATPETYVLGIRGWEFNEFGQRLSPRAIENLDEAVAWVRERLAKGQFEEVRPADGELRSPADLDI